MSPSASGAFMVSTDAEDASDRGERRFERTRYQPRKGTTVFTVVGFIILLVCATLVIPLMVLRSQVRSGRQEMIDRGQADRSFPRAIQAGLLPVSSPSSTTSPSPSSTTHVVSPTKVQDRFIEASALQRLLPHLAAVELAARQVRWNVYGSAAEEIRSVLDTLGSDVSRQTERVAGRLIERGFTPDARPTQIVATAVQTRAGRLSVDEAETMMGDALSAAASPAFDAVVALESSGSVGHDIARTTLSVLRTYATRFESRPRIPLTSMTARRRAAELTRRSDCA